MKIAFLILLVCLTEYAFAQKSFFGVDAGVNVANQLEVAYSTPKWKSYSYGQPSIKPAFGFFYQHELSALFAIRISAAYMGLGYNFRTFAPQKVDINYLTFPLSFQYKANKHFLISAGPYLSFTLGGSTINGDVITKTYHKNDFGFSFGAEHDLFKNFAFRVSYFYGLKNIWLADTVYDPITGLTYHYEVTNRALQFALIYKFQKNN